MSEPAFLCLDHESLRDPAWEHYVFRLADATISEWERRNRHLLIEVIAACPAVPVVGCDAVDLRVPAWLWREIQGGRGC